MNEYFSGEYNKKEDEKVYHNYYQWVPIILSIQAVLFYAPHWIWKNLEDDRLAKIVAGLNNAIDDPTEVDKKVDNITNYMIERMKLSKKQHDHQIWAMKFFACECLNFINVVVQIIATDKFMGGQFSTYGTEVLNFPSQEAETRVDPMSRIFPRMTKCTFHKYGGSATIQVIDSLCVLGMNIVNEKIYIFLWFWFIILAIVTGLNLVVRLFQYYVPNIRQRLTDLEDLGQTQIKNLDKTIDNKV